MIDVENLRDTKICVVGIWHLGAVVAGCLADLGYNVVGIERDAARAASLNDGVPPLFEPGLAELFHANLDAGRLNFTSDTAAAVRGAKYVIVTFDTPVDDNDEIDLTPVLEACREIGRNLEDGSYLVISSQVPVGTCDEIRKMIATGCPALKFDIACSPENLRLGGAIKYFKKPDRIIIGADSAATLDAVEEMFSVIPAPKVRMDLRSAEMSKHAINAFLATTISFANELANLCDEAGADALQVARALKMESRIGPKLPLLPGLAFGGGTLARDLKILKKLGERTGYPAPLINGVLAVNGRQNGLVLRKLANLYGSVNGLTIVILGLTYKPGTSTLRRSPALDIIADLTRAGAQLKAYDPKATPEELKKYTGFTVSPDPYAAARDADAAVIVTDWPEFRELDFGRLKSVMKNPVLVDARNMLYDRDLTGLGFTYLGVGVARASGGKS